MKTATDLRLVLVSINTVRHYTLVGLYFFINFSDASFANQNCKSIF